MKAITSIISLLCVPALCATAQNGPLGPLDGFLPLDSLMQGAVVQPEFSPELGPVLKAVEESFQKLPEEERKTMLEKRDLESALEYSPKLWSSKAEYDKYIKIWNATTLKELQGVAMGFAADKTAGMYKVVSVTAAQDGKTLPLTIGALKYNARNNTWVSNNGVLEAEPVKTDSKNMYGAQTGFIYKFDKADELSRQVETVKVTKTDDGKYVFVSYAFVEVIVDSGQPIAQGGYILRFPVKSAGASVSRPGQK